MGFWRACLLLSAWILMPVSESYAHSDAILNCNQNIKYSEAVKVPPDVLLTDRGIYVEHYDTNGDGKFDVAVFSHSNTDGRTHRENPIFWMVDLDFDTVPDAVYIDKKGLGICTDIVLFEDLNAMAPTDETDPLDRGREM